MFFFRQQRSQILDLSDELSREKRLSEKRHVMIARQDQELRRLRADRELLLDIVLSNSAHIRVEDLSKLNQCLS